MKPSAVRPIQMKSTNDVEVNYSTIDENRMQSKQSVQFPLATADAGMTSMGCWRGLSPFTTGRYALLHNFRCCPELHKFEVIAVGAVIKMARR